MKRRNDIIVTKPDKGSGVVIMDRSEYIRLLCEASVNDTTKFAQVISARPPKGGRPPKRFHPLLEREKHLQSVVDLVLLRLHV